jgi:hypothetical protein
MKKYLIFILSLSTLIIPVTSFALELSYPTINGLTIEPDMDINKLIMWLYYFLVSISGLAAFATIVWGGVSWLTSAGNPAKASDAKEKITSALLGLLLVLGSWIFLNIINPDLLIFNLPNYFH